MDMSELKELIELFENSCVTEMEYERGELRVRLKRDHGGTISVEHVAQSADSVGNAAARIPANVAASRAAAGEAAVAEPEEDTGVVMIGAPMVGIFYAGPAPDADPFVTVGQTIEEGQTVAIISAMKVMNEIKAELAGTVHEIFVENGQTVEYNQPLFAIEPALSKVP